MQNKETLPVSEAVNPALDGYVQNLLALFLVCFHNVYAVCSVIFVLLYCVKHNPHI